MMMMMTIAFSGLEERVGNCYRLMLHSTVSSTCFALLWSLYFVTPTPQTSPLSLPFPLFLPFLSFFSYFAFFFLLTTGNSFASLSTFLVPLTLAKQNLVAIEHELQTYSDFVFSRDPRKSSLSLSDCS